MSKETIKLLIQEKFGYVTDFDKVNKKRDLDDPTRGKDPQKSAHPLEKFREFIKLALGATTTDQDAKIENLIDLDSVIRLANKYALQVDVINNLKNIKAEFEKSKPKRDKEEILKLWNDTKNKIPYWFLTLMPNNRKEEMEEKDKEQITNLLNYMAHFNKESEKVGKELSKNTEHAARTTAAKDNLDKARKDAGIKDKDAGAEKKLKEKPETPTTEGAEKAKAPEVPEKEKDIIAVKL